MSRVHLYRATRPPRPLISGVLFTLWLGAALLCLATLLPLAGRGNGTTAAIALERLLPLVGLAGLFAGGIAIAAELALQRARFRVLRLVCAAALMVAGAVVSFGADGRSDVLHAASDDRGAGGVTLAAARSAHEVDLAWLVVGVVAAAGGLVGAALALRHDEVV